MTTPVRGDARTPGPTGGSVAPSRADGGASPRPEGGPRWAALPAAVRVVVLVASAVVAVVAGVAFSGAVAPRVLADPGAAVRWGLPVAETLTELAGAVALGALVLAVGVLPRRQAALAA